MATRKAEKRQITCKKNQKKEHDIQIQKQQVKAQEQEEVIDDLVNPKIPPQI